MKVKAFVWATILDKLNTFGNYPVQWLKGAVSVKCLFQLLQ